MGDLSSEGSTFYESPHIDRIASEEIKFTRSCVTCPVRNPSRASTPTGKYPTKHEITTWIGDRSGTACRSTGHPDNYLTSMYQHDLPADEMTLAETLRDAGYKTFFAGKWHPGSQGSWPSDHSFKINKGGWDVGSPHGGYFSPWENPNLKPSPADESLPIRTEWETAL